MFSDKKVISQATTAGCCEKCGKFNKFILKIEHTFVIRDIPLFPYKWSYISICEGCSHEGIVQKSEIGSLVFSKPKLWLRRFYGIPLFILLIAGVAAYIAYEQHELLKSFENPQVGTYYQYYHPQDKVDCVLRIVGVDGNVLKVQYHAVGYSGSGKGKNRHIKNNVCETSNDPSQWSETTEILVEELKNSQYKITRKFRCD